MTYLSTEMFKFASMTLPGNTFGVIDFHGAEGLSSVYEFTINLVSTNRDIDLAEMLEAPAVLTIHFGERHIPIRGVPREFVQLHEHNGYVFYRAVLVPRLWRLNLMHHNQVFLNMSTPDMLKAVLRDTGSFADMVDFRLTGAYAPREYVCQYRESNFNFFSRWLEHEGMYYFFLRSETNPRMIITDTSLAHIAMAGNEKLVYAPISGLEQEARHNIIYSFGCHQRALPAVVTLQDYNYRTPDLSIEAAAPISDSGHGDVHLYGDNLRTPSEAKTLAAIRADEFRCQERVFYAKSWAPYVRPGFCFTLEGHYTEAFNQEYLTTSAHHRGCQAAHLLAPIQGGLGRAVEEPNYENEFTAIPAAVQFRPPCKTPKPRIHSTLTANIDAEGNGQYAELDEHGRYKVILPFDRSGRKDGRASCWLRMLQPYAGKDHGMHFPLHKGCEVALAFFDGDPDQPYIAGSLTNLNAPSPVTAANQTQARITTAGGNKIHIEDADGSQRILMQSPTANTWMRLGAPNDPPTTNGGPTTPSDPTSPSDPITPSDPTSPSAPTTPSVPTTPSAPTTPSVPTTPSSDSSPNWGLSTNTDGSYELHVGGAKLEFVYGETTSDIAVLANRFEFTGGGSEEVVVGGKMDFVLGVQIEIHVPQKLTIAVEKIDAELEHLKAHGEEITVGASKTVVAGSLGEVLAQHSKATADAVNLIGAETTARGEETKAIGSRIDTVASDIKAKGSEITNLGSQIKNVGSVIQDIGSTINTVGSKVDTVGSDITTAGTRIKTAGANITNGVILQN